MSGRFLHSTMTMAAVLAILSVTRVSDAGQAPPARKASASLDAARQSEVGPPAQTWNPPRTSDGQPDIQGFWGNQGRRLALYNVEEGADERHVLLSGNETDHQSLIVDPPFVDPDTISYQATFEDPNVYTRPFKMALSFARTVRGEEAKDYELLESACYEGDRNMQHSVQAK